MGRLLAEVSLTDLLIATPAACPAGAVTAGRRRRVGAQTGAAHRRRVTSMVDPRRDDLLSVLSGLADRRRMALVHITHYNVEAETRTA